MRRTHWRAWVVVGSRCTRISTHPVCRNPTGVIEFGLDFLATHFLRNVRDAHPQHSNGCGAITRFVVNCKFNFVCFVDIDGESLINPFVDSARFRPGLDRIFHLDNNIGFRATGESRASGMIHILNGMDAHCKKTSQWLAHVWAAKTFVYKVVSILIIGLIE